MAEYIKKEDVLKLLEKNSITKKVTLADGISIYDSVKNAPTADVVEVKRGEWKLHPDGSGTCSCCNRTQKSVWDYDNAQNFCGHCGADMRGEEK